MSHRFYGPLKPSRHLPYLSWLVLIACGSHSENSSDGSGGAGNDSRSSIQALSYAEAFPEDRVRRIDIKISAENWQEMLADMTSMLGAFGTGAQGTKDPPATGAGGAGPGGVPPLTGPGAASTQVPNGEPPSGSVPQPGGVWGTAGAAGVDPSASSFPMFGQAGAASGGIPSGAMMPDGGGQAMGEGSVDLIPRTPIYVECDVESEGAALHHVGIRFKGNSSLSMPWQQGIYKLPLRLKFDEFESEHPETKNQRYYGFANLSLSNGQADPSLLRDKIGTEVFVRAGFAAPATAFYQVYIDHGDGPTYFGLYTATELPKEDAFLQRFFVNDRGNLYKPDGAGARFQTYDEATLGKENNEDAADYSDVRALFDALQADRADAAAWRAGLEARFDVNTFLHWLALNTVVQDWDTYGQMAHNYYLYADPSTHGRLVWIPWDHSYAFAADQRVLELSLSSVTQAWPLIRYLLDDVTYAQVYRNFVAQAATEEYEPTWAVARFQSAHDLIAPYVTGANGERNGYSFVTSEQTFELGLTTLKNHVTQRQGEVAAFLAE